MDGRHRRKHEPQVRSEWFGAEGRQEPTHPSERFAGPFKIGVTLGRGITGSVKLGVHVDTGFQVALKCVKKKYLQEKQERWKTFRREMAIMKMMDHPNIIKLYDVFESTSRIYLVCEYVKGGELFDYISGDGLPKTEALRLFGQILLAIQHAHDYGIVHRDLKPENILLDEEKNIKIGDFGMARFIKLGAVLHTSCGSPHYTSPEVIDGNYDGKKSDVWSLGVIFYAMASGCLPFNHENISIMFGLIKSGDYQIPPEVDPDLCDLIRAMLQVEPAKRINLEDITFHKAFYGTSMYRAPLRFPLSSPTVPLPSPTVTSTPSPGGLSTPSLSVFSPSVSVASPALSIPSPLSAPASSPISVSSPLSSPGKSISSPLLSSCDLSFSPAFETGKFDENLIEDMISLGGWEHRDEVVSKLQETENNLEKGVYRLLSDRKRTRLDELSRLSPRRRLRTIPRPHSRSSLSSRPDLRELPEFELPQPRDDSYSYSSYLENRSPRAPRVDLRVQIAKRRAKLGSDGGMSSSVQGKSTGGQYTSGSILFGHLPEFITNEDIRSLQPFLSSSSSSNSSSSNSSSSSSSSSPSPPSSAPTATLPSTPSSKLSHSGSDEWNISYMLQHLATSNRPRSPSQTRAVARPVGRREGDSPEEKSPLKLRERQTEMGMIPDDTLLSPPSGPGRRLSFNPEDEHPTTPKRSSKLPPKKTPETPPSPAAPSSPLLQWFSNFFRRRPSLDPWAKGEGKETPTARYPGRGSVKNISGGGKDTATARYQVRANTKNRSNYLQKTYALTPTSTSSSLSTQMTIPQRSSPIAIPTSSVVVSMSSPNLSTGPSTESTEMALSMSLETIQNAPLPDVKEEDEKALSPRPEKSPRLDHTVTKVAPRLERLEIDTKSSEIKEENYHFTFFDTSSSLSFSTVPTITTSTPSTTTSTSMMTAKTSPRFRSLTTTTAPTTQISEMKEIIPRPKRSDTLPMSHSIESEIKQRKRHTKERTPSNNSPNLPKKKSFFGRYRRLQRTNSTSSSLASSTSTTSVTPSVSSPSLPSASTSSTISTSSSSTTTISPFSSSSVSTLSLSTSSSSPILPASSPVFLSSTTSYLGTTSSTYFGSAFAPKGGSDSSFISSSSAVFLSVSPPSNPSIIKSSKFFKPKKKPTGRKRTKSEKKGHKKQQQQQQQQQQRSSPTRSSLSGEITQVVIPVQLASYDTPMTTSLITSSTRSEISESTSSLTSDRDGDLVML